MTDDSAHGPRDASQVGHEAARTAWAEAARDTLLEAAGRYRATVSHKKLADAMQAATGITTTQLVASWIGDVLGRVTDDCRSRGEPFLSSLCISAQGSVGQGYADAVALARGTRPDDPDDHAAHERLACYRHWRAAGLPADGGTPLRTAHFVVARRPRAAATPRTPGAPRAPRKTAAPAKPKVEPKPIPVCPTCFTALPASGVCDYCD